MPQVVNPVKFNNIILSEVVPGLTVLAVNSYVPPKRTLTINGIARTNRNKVSTGFFTSKEIIVTVGITRDTRANAEISLGVLLTYIQNIEADLVVIQEGLPRRYTATYSDCDITTGGGSYLEVDLVFTLSESFGYNLSYETLLSTTGRTLYNYTDTLTFNGTAQAQLPIITAFLSALSGATTNQVTIKNVATGVGITVNRAWTAGDRLVIDSQNRTVTVNGTAADFSGGFPEFTPGVNYLNYQDNFVSRTLALSAYYYRRFV